MSKDERTPGELALSPRALADAQNAAAAEIVGRAFERGLSEEDVALALREREAAQAASAAGAAGAAPVASDAGAITRSGVGASAEDAAELTRDTIPQRGPLALPRVVAATKPRMQGVALPVPERDPSLAAEPGARGVRESGDDSPAGMPRTSRALPLAILLLLGAGALALWLWSKGDPPQQPNQATSAVPMGSEPVRVPPPPEQTASSAAAPASASAVPQMAPTASASASTTAAVPSAKASAKPSASAQTTASTRPSAAPRPSATPAAPNSGTPPTPSAKPSSWFVPQ